MEAFAFDRDGTLAWGNPPGPITILQLLKLKELGYVIGGSGGQSREEQEEDWRKNGIKPDFCIYKGMLALLPMIFREATHVDDDEDIKKLVQLSKAKFMRPEEFIAWLEGK